MNGFDVTLTVGRVEIGIPTEEALDHGATPAVQIEVGVAVALPFAAGPGQPPIAMEMGTVRFSLDYEKAKGFFTEGVKAVEQLPKPSSLLHASDLKDAERAAQALDRLKGNGSGSP